MAFFVSTNFIYFWRVELQRLSIWISISRLAWCSLIDLTYLVNRTRPTLDEVGRWVRDRGLTNIFRRRNRIGGITKQRMLSAAMLNTDPMIVVNLPFLSSFYSKTSIPKEMEDRRDNLSELEIALAFLNEWLSADLLVKLYIFASGL